MLDDQSAEIRKEAAAALGGLGKSAQPALPRLAPLVRDPVAEVRAAAAGALGGLELEAEAVREPLAEALRDDEAEVRQTAMRAVQRLGPSGALFVPDLIRMAGRPRERQGVERALRRFEKARPDDRAVAGLIALLGHEKEGVRELAARFLGLAGPRASAALPALERLKDDPSEEVRERAAEARRLIEEPVEPDSDS
jgi:HEAT repeat protein